MIRKRRYNYRRGLLRSRMGKPKYRSFNTRRTLQVGIIFIILCILGYLTLGRKNSETKKEPTYNEYQEKIRALEIEPNIIREIFNKARETQEDESTLFASYIAQREKGKNDEYILKNISKYKPSLFTSSKIKKMYKETKECYNQFITDIKDFPVPKDYGYMFENSWNAERTYGGIRKHYGTDIMDTKNTRGEIPVTSVSDGVVESIGWLNLGGYRVGVRTPSGGFIYYAHLDSYAPKLKKGTRLKVGDAIGYMGDSGYGDEGTVGQFPVHLHIGIATKALGSKETWVNPYYILKYLEEERGIGQ